MNTSFIHKSTCLFLAMFMFFSSAGISLNIHYCGDEIADFSFFGSQVGCSCIGTSDKHSDSMTFTKRGCCSFDQFKIDTSDEYRFSQFDKENPISINAFFTSFEAKTFVYYLISNSRLETYPPPELEENPLYIQNESLLI